MAFQTPTGMLREQYPHQNFLDLDKVVIELVQTKAFYIRAMTQSISEPN
jgi:hypothetical protein